jgi:hypothetical protein
LRGFLVQQETNRIKGIGQCRQAIKGFATLRVLPDQHLDTGHAVVDEDDIVASVAIEVLEIQPGGAVFKLVNFPIAKTKRPMGFVIGLSGARRQNNKRQHQQANKSCGRVVAHKSLFSMFVIEIGCKPMARRNR